MLPRVHRAGVRRGLETSRRGGVAYGRGELMPDVRCVAAGVHGVGEQIIAALSMSPLAERCRPSADALACAIVDGEREIEHHLRQRSAPRVDRVALL
jgi:DNA-binding IclR family transcriptional regulator